MSLSYRKISFDSEAHAYKDEFDDPYISVTTKIGLFQEKYDVEYWAVFTALKDSGYKVIPKQDTRQIGIRVSDKFKYFSIFEINFGLAKVVYKVTPAQIKKQWEENTNASHGFGNHRHSYLEDQINLMFDEKEKSEYTKAHKDNKFEFYSKIKIANLEQIEKSDLKVKFPSIYNKIVLMINKGYSLYCEVRIYHPDYKIAGTIDLLFVKGKDFVILDWKTNKHKLKFESGYYKKEKEPNTGRTIITNKFIKTKNKLLKPLNILDDCKGVIYSLQLSLYASILEDWGYTCKRLILCHFEPIKTVYGDVELLNEFERKEYEPQFFIIDYTEYKKYADLIKTHKTA